MPVASPSRKDEGGRAPAAEPSWHSRACLWLLFGTLVWGLSFPLLKVIALAQQRLVPGASSWFLASLTVCVRFAAAALALLCWCLPTLGRLTRSEIWHGVGLGVFGGIGMFLQVDGLMYTAASTSAFLTQMTCLLIPLWVAVGCTLVIIWCCTVVSYGLMNHWQPRVTATEAGLIYCAEPLFASVFALFLPGWLAGPARINYANETLTRNLLVGGGLITLANILIQIPGRRNRN